LRLYRKKNLSQFNSNITAELRLGQLSSKINTQHCAWQESHQFACLDDRFKMLFRHYELLSVFISLAPETKTSQHKHH
jgi:hypothetical protein